MKTQWDYTDLAEQYLKRADYADSAIDRFAAMADLQPGDPICDIGAGVGHLTRKWQAKELTITAVEPNDAMRALGIKHTADNVTWFEGTGEETGQAAQAFKAVSFGSSFNVTDRQKTLQEVKRILQPKGWFTCLWNHRDLDDPIQRSIEEYIASHIDNYQYGTRREDQTAVIEASGLFTSVEYIEGQVTHEQHIADVVEAWRSHATLQRQAGDKFTAICDGIEALLNDLKQPSIMVPYTTRMWAAQLID